MWSRARLGLALLVIADISGAAEVRSNWLAVAGEYKVVLPALAMRKQLQLSWPQASVVASSDCSNLTPGLYLVVAISTNNRRTALRAVDETKSRNPDSYVRECRPKPDSRIILGVPLIDPSIDKVPQSAVNWTDGDRISAVIKLPEEGYLWIRRRYEGDAEDPREGRRESVLFFPVTPELSTQLEADCTDPTFSQRKNRIALSCARETAGDNLLHETGVYETPRGRQIFSISRCRNPELISSTEVRCQAEEVDHEGQLRLQTKKVPLP